MSRRRDSYGFNRSRRGSTVFWIFFGIIAFAAIYFPFFGGNLRSQIGNFTTGIFSKIGLLLFFGGLILLGIGLITIVTGKLKGIKIALLGFILVWVAMNFFDPGLGGVLTNNAFPRGYY